ncbi:MULTISPECIES: hypothetical protein [unclassified Bartonella]|uniref:hypothetical protein n=1 Tax=unclassified Bartonella TaxID=2645622 RepID=UPI0035D03353
MSYGIEIDLSLVIAVVIYFIANFGLAYTLYNSCKTTQRLRKKIDEKDKIIDKEAEIIHAQKDVTQKQEESMRRLTASKIIFPRMAVKNLAKK